MATEWRHVEEYLSAALALAPEHRAAYLDTACAGQDTLRRSVEAFLALEQDVEDFLETPPAPVAHLSIPPAPRRDLPTGHVVGPYRIVKVLGRGGMSTVYLAETVDCAAWRVALKVLQPDVNNGQVARRFLAEQRILAQLDHPNIARLYDGGTTTDGLPYFVMEAIEGMPIDAFCDARRLTIEARLELFRSVCSAVHYAHQNLVVHRDIKPSNILVTDDGVPKLLDFGIAKVLAGGLGEGADPTLTLWRAMTPNYASPEQMRGQPITTASDVYSLGVLLYKLTTGHLPYRIEGVLRDMDPEHHLQRLLEPSQVVQGKKNLGDRDDGGPVNDSRRNSTAASGLAALRAVTPDKLSRLLRGDLDNIILKALRLEALRRYRSVESLAEDLRRWRVGLPVHARPDTLLYRGRKFLGRHTLAVALGVSMLLLVVSFAVLSARHSARLEHERQQTDAVAEFLISLYGSPSLGLDDGDSITARELLEQGARRVEEGSGMQPMVRSTLLHSIGRGFNNLRLFDRALPLFDQALESRRQILGATHPQTLETLHHRAVALRGSGDYEASAEAFEQALVLGRQHGQASLAVAKNLNGLTALRRDQGDFVAAEVSGRQALELLRRRLGEQHHWTAQSKALLASVLFDSESYEEAETLYRQAIPVLRRVGGQAPLAQSLNGLAMLRVQRGDAESAEPLIREALGLYRSVFGEHHPAYAHSLMILSFIHQEAADLGAAETESRRSLKILRDHYPAGHPRIARVEYNLALILSERGDHGGAEALLRRALAVAQRALGTRHVRYANCQVDLARALHAQGRLDEAEQLYRQALVTLEAAPLGTSHQFVAHARFGLGALLVDLGRWQEAAGCLESALGALQETLAADHWRLAQVRSELAASYMGMGRQLEAEPLLVESYQTLMAQRGADSEISRRAGRHVQAYTRSATSAAANLR